MKVLLSWVREFVDIDESAESIGRLLSLRGLALEGLEHLPHLTARPDGGVDAGGDWLLDFDVTANRPDCLSMAGIAREIAVAFGRPFREPSARWVPAATATEAVPTLPITIEAPDLCARYVGAVADVTVAPSPAWMAGRLAACGVRPISNIVDITNYVLLELGHPMHAFDYARLAGPAIVVRRARAAEPLTTLDGRARSLGEDMLVIADEARATAIGGVMGGADSEVSATTRRIVFEAAWFHPPSVRVTSRRLGLRTEASMRFERGADLAAPPVAMTRACALLAEIGAGSPVGGLVDAYPQPRAATTLFLARPRIPGLLGMPVPDEAVERILAGLGFAVKPADGGWWVTAPSWRVDIHRDVDVIEEVGRHHGFEHLPATFPGVQQAPAPWDPRIARDQRARQIALATGFSEAISFAFIEARHAAPFLGGDAPVALANPLSETFAVMRPSLVPGLAQAVGHNRRHGRRDVQLFEIGTRFSPHGETRAMALAWTGVAEPEHWSGQPRDVDFFDMKGAIAQLAAAFDVDVDLAIPADGSVASSVLVPGRAATITAGGASIGWLGQLASTIVDAHGIPAADDVYVAEIDLDALSARAPAEARRAVPLPRFPAASRDIAMLVDESLSAATVRGTIRSTAPSTLVQVSEFDRYQGKGIPDGKVSLALRLTFQSPDRTLTDAEVDAATTTIVEALAARLGAVRR